MRLMFDPLVGSLDLDASLSKENGIANDWEMAPDGMKWTFNLRKGIKFENGEDLTAEDFVHTMSLTLSEESSATHKTDLQAKVNGIEDFQAVGPYELVINTKIATPFLASNLSDVEGTEGFIMPKDYIEGTGIRGFEEKPMGSGPYRYVDQRVGDFLLLEAVGTSHWREGVPKFKTVRYRVIPEPTTAIAALKAGEIDIIPIPRERVADVEADGFQIFRQEGFAVVGVYFHEMWRENSAWKDIRVRKALNLAVDRDELCETILAGECSPAIVYPWPDIFEGIADGIAPYGYDPVEARRLLDDAGYDGTEFRILTYPRNNFPEGVRFLEAIAGYWRAVGVNAVNVPTEAARASADRRAHVLDNSSTYVAAENRPLPAWVAILRVIFHTTGSLTVTQEPVVDAIIERLETSIDPNDALAAMKDLTRWFHDEYGTLTTVNINIPYAASDKITNWNLGQRPYDQNYLQIAVGR